MDAAAAREDRSCVDGHDLAAGVGAGEDVGGRGIRRRLAETAGDDGIVRDEVVDVAPVDEALVVAEGRRGRQIDDLEAAARGIRLRREELAQLARDRMVGVGGVALIVQQQPAGGRERRDDVDVSVRAELVVVPGEACLLYTSPSPRDLSTSRMPSSA